MRLMLRPFALILLLSLVASCGKDPIYSVPDRIQPYIDEFIAQAAMRGTDLEIDDLVVLFEEDLDVDGKQAAGVCTRSRKDPPTIKLDTTTLNWSANLSSREQLVFHELGHCVLNRSHLDVKMTDGNYRSVMRASGEQLYGPRLSSFKRSWYFDELFHEDSVEPLWVSEAENYNSVASRSLAFEEDFENGAGGWNTGESANTVRTVSNGYYILLVRNPDNYFVSNTLEIDDSRDFEIEVMIGIQGDGFAGVLWGGNQPVSGVPAFHTMFFDNDVVSVGTILDGTESSYATGQVFTNGDNKVTIRHSGDRYLYFVNEERVDHMDFATLNGSTFGLSFGGAAGALVRIDHIRLYYLD